MWLSSVWSTPMVRGTFYKLVSWDIFLFKCILFSCSYLWSKCHFVLIDQNGNFLLKLIIGRHCYWIPNWTTQSQCVFVFMFWMISFFFPNTHKMLGLALSCVFINEMLTQRDKMKKKRKKKKKKSRFRHITWVASKSRTSVRLRSLFWAIEGSTWNSLEDYWFVLS